MSTFTLLSRGCYSEREVFLKKLHAFCFIKTKLADQEREDYLLVYNKVDRQYERAHTRIHRMTFNDSSTYKTDAVNVLFLCIFLRKVWLYMWCFIMKLVTSRSIVFGRIEFKLHRQL